MTKDGAIVVTHWPRPMIRDGFRDPKKKLRRTRTVASMTLAQVQRLRTKDGYRILTLSEALEACADAKVKPVLEPKDDRRFNDPELWRKVEAEALAVGVHPEGYSLRSNGRGRLRVAAMKLAGIKARLLGH
jgi:glycerophosphoryl diester phosphodiesterase